MQHFNLIIIGGGPAGLTAGIYGSRSGLSTLILEEMVCGGAMATAPFIENYPGYEKITGFDLAQIMKNHAIKSGVIIKELEPVSKIEIEDKIKKVYTSTSEYSCDALIIATGGKRRRLNAKGEKEYTGKGVSYCAICDGALYKGKKVAVVGGSNCAASAALYLSNLANETYLIHRRNKLRCEKVLNKQLIDSKIELIWNSVVKEIKGSNILESIIVNNIENKKDAEIKVDGLFIEIGIIPNSKIAVEAGIKVNAAGYIIVDRYMQTNISGVYAAGDITGGFEQIAVAVGEGTIAYDSAYQFINQGKYPGESCETI
jgi:thioredoxin reductase (NADPH)